MWPLTWRMPSVPCTALLHSFPLLLPGYRTISQVKRNFTGQGMRQLPNCTPSMGPTNCPRGDTARMMPEWREKKKKQSYKWQTLESRWLVSTPLSVACGLGKISYIPQASATWAMTCTKGPGYPPQGPLVEFSGTVQVIPQHTLARQALHRRPQPQS